MYDALIILAWVAVNILYVQQKVSLILPIFKSAPPRMLPMVSMHAMNSCGVCACTASSCNHAGPCRVLAEYPSVHAEFIEQGLLPELNETKALIAL